jgi:predicted MFS family arabinose efflux permease
MVTYQSLLQSRLAPSVRGRAFSLFDVIGQAGRLASLGLGGMMADGIGISSVYVVGGLLLLLASLVGAVGSRFARLG